MELSILRKYMDAGSDGLHLGIFQSVPELVTTSAMMLYVPVRFNKAEAVVVIHQRTAAR